MNGYTFDRQIVTFDLDTEIGNTASSLILEQITQPSDYVLSVKHIEGSKYAYVMFTSPKVSRVDEGDLMVNLDGALIKNKCNEPTIFTYIEEYQSSAVTRELIDLTLEEFWSEEYIRGEGKIVALQAVSDETGSIVGLVFVEASTEGIEDMLLR